MKIFHTSPVKISKIHSNGLFEDCLFFALKPYVMTQSDSVYTYSIEIDESKIIPVSELYHEKIIADMACALGIGGDVAERLLDGRDNVFEHGFNGEDDWWIQAKQGECAKKMGYEACKSCDEQGSVYIVPMLNKENELILVD